jgi:hypothetical protein
MTRTPQEVFAHHGPALAAADIDEIAADFADDAVVITPAGVHSGKDGVRAAFRRLFADLADATWDIKGQTWADDVLLLALAFHRGRVATRVPIAEGAPELGRQGS